MRKVRWIIVKSYYTHHKLVDRELYGYFNKVKECTKMLRDYKNVVLNKQEPFLKDAETVTGHYVRSRLDVRGNNGQLIEFRVYSLNIFLL